MQPPPQAAASPYDYLKPVLDAHHAWAESGGLQGKRGDLAGHDLTKADLSDRDLRGIVLQGTVLPGASLQRASLGPVLVADAADPAKVEVVTADLRGAVLRGADLRGAELAGVDLSGADLARAHLEGTLLASTKLVGADLTGAYLRGADLYEVDLAGVQLADADLSEADLQETENLRLSHSYIRNARFSPFAEDPWSMLRRSYSGHQGTFHLLLLIVFVVPWLARPMLWVIATQLETPVIRSARAAADWLDRQEDPEAKRLAEKVRQGLTSSSESWWTHYLERWTGWGVLREALLLGVAGLAILYNVVRAFLVWRVGPLREEEDRSGYAPAWYSEGWKELWPLRRAMLARDFVARVWRSRIWADYGWLMRVHEVMRWLWWALFVLIALNVVFWVGAAMAAWLWPT